MIFQKFVKFVFFPPVFPVLLRITFGQPNIWKLQVPRFSCAAHILQFYPIRMSSWSQLPARQICAPSVSFSPIVKEKSHVIHHSEASPFSWSATPQAEPRACSRLLLKHCLRFQHSGAPDWHPRPSAVVDSRASCGLVWRQRCHCL